MKFMVKYPQNITHMAQCNVDIDNSQGSVVRYSPDQLLLNTAEALRGAYDRISYFRHLTANTT